MSLIACEAEVRLAMVLLVLTALAGGLARDLGRLTASVGRQWPAPRPAAPSPRRRSGPSPRPSLGRFLQGLRILLRRLDRIRDHRRCSARARASPAPAARPRRRYRLSRSQASWISEAVPSVLSGEARGDRATAANRPQPAPRRAVCACEPGASAAARAATASRSAPSTASVSRSIASCRERRARRRTRQAESAGRPPRPEGRRRQAGEGETDRQQGHGQHRAAGIRHWPALAPRIDPCRACPLHDHGHLAPRT